VTYLVGHLGPRVSALLDGRMDAGEGERAWAHVHACHACRDLVEREGWVKTRLAGLGGGTGAPADLKGSLLGSPPRDGAPAPVWAGWTAPPGEAFLAMAADHRPRRTVGLAALGGGALGAAMMGMIALGAAPASAPTLDRRLPTSSIAQPGQSAPAGLPGFVGPQRRPSQP
jgi:hypothetical protein